MEALDAKYAAIALRKAGSPVTYGGSTLYALLEFDLALYPSGYQSGSPIDVNMATFLRSELDTSPVGDTFVYGADTYTIVQVLPEESDTNTLSVLFE